MNTGIEQWLSALPAKSPPACLEQDIMSAIQARQVNVRVKRQAWAFGTGLMTVVAGLSIYWNMFMAELAQSAFTTYLRVLVTDYDLAMLNWRESILALLESLPVVNLIAWSLLAFFAVGLVSRLIRMRATPVHHHLATN